MHAPYRGFEQCIQFRMQTAQTEFLSMHEVISRAAWCAGPGRAHACVLSVYGVT